MNLHLVSCLPKAAHNAGMIAHPIAPLLVAWLLGFILLHPVGLKRAWLCAPLAVGVMWGVMILGHAL